MLKSATRPDYAKAPSGLVLQVLPVLLIFKMNLKMLALVALVSASEREALEALKK